MKKAKTKYQKGDYLISLDCAQSDEDYISTLHKLYEKEELEKAHKLIREIDEQESKFDIEYNILKLNTRFLWLRIGSMNYSPN